MKGPLVLTGASGWFGRTALHVYEQEHGPEALRRDVIALASRPCCIDFGSPHGPISALPLAALRDLVHPRGLLHLAFLTRDRVAQLGWQRYVALNQGITALVLEVVQRWPEMPVVMASSGAALAAEGRNADALLRTNPYAVLKLLEEQGLARLAQTRLAVVFRVFAASGRFMTRADHFALGDFLLQALSGGPVVVKNPGLVLRSYIHAGDLTRAAWRLLRGAPDHGLQNPGFHRLDACTHTLRLVDLARCIARQHGVAMTTSAIASEASHQDLYIGDTLSMTSLLRALHLPVSDMQMQIDDTRLGLMTSA